MHIDEDELDDIDDFGEDNDLLLNGNLANEDSQVNHFGHYQHENQQNMFGDNQDDDDDNVDENDKKSLNNNMERDKAAQNHNNNISDNDSISENSADNQDSTHSAKRNSDDKYGDESDINFYDLSTEDNPASGKQLCGVLHELQPRKRQKGLGVSNWIDTYPMIASMNVAEEVDIRMIKEYFEIDASKTTSQYRFRKGLKLFGDRGYQATKNELEKNLLGRGCIDMLSTHNATWGIRNKC